MNNMIILGSLLCYTSVYLLGVDTRQINDTGYVVFCYVGA